MLSKTDAIVLYSVKYGDSRLIVDMFTREHGRMSFIVSVGKGGRSQMKKQYFQPLTLLAVEADVRPQQSLQRLRNVSLLSPWMSLLTEPAKLSIALFVAEFLNYALRGEQQDTRLFDYVRSSLMWLDNRTDRYANFHLVFLMHLSRFLGFFPNLAAPATVPGGFPPGPAPAHTASPPPATVPGGFPPGLYFDLRAGTFCSAPPPHPDYLLPPEASLVRPLMRMDFATMHLFRLSRADRGRMLEVMERYYRLHLPAFPELRSLPVLRELYD